LQSMGIYLVDCTQINQEIQMFTHSSIESLRLIFPGVRFLELLYTLCPVDVWFMRLHHIALILPFFTLPFL
jgi:hypothetical protein